MRRRVGHDSRGGSVAIEMAIVLPFLIAMIYLIIEVGRLLYTVAALHFAVERASRCAVVDAAACGGGAPKTPQCYAAAWALGLGLGCGNVNATGTCAIAGSPNGGTEISIDYTFQSPVMQLLPGGNELSLPLHAQSCFPV
jgi:hypothetical protein